MTHTLTRETFTTSRMMDFLSRKELTAQTGHRCEDWPLVALKELMDNALDACEDARISPEIEVAVDAGGITVTDNGPGIPESTIRGVLDFSVKVSSREAYISPTRGAQGNALKTIMAMPFVLDGKRGSVEVTAHGVRHDITLELDHVHQQPRFTHKTAEYVKTGTTVSIVWPDSASSILHNAREQFLQIAEDYTFLNPHLKLTLDWFGKRRQIDATAPDWAKWLPSDPTSPHWYEVEHLTRLITGYIAHDQLLGGDRTVREFIGKFKGFSGSSKQKAVLEATGLGRVNLSTLVTDRGVEQELVALLLKAMRQHSKPIKPAALGIIGRGHIEQRFADLGCEAESFNYRKVADESEDGLPFVLETAFGWCENLSSRRIVTGVNWAPGIVNPFRQLGAVGRSLDGILEQQCVGRDEPIIFLLHAASPRVAYTDRGKSAVVVRI